MHTTAVFRAAQALADVKIAALRFNFRGVGTSTGSYDQGFGETEDVLAALDWLEERHPGLPLVVGGFSFGSMVAFSAAAEDSRVVALFGLGLPIRMYDYRFLANIPKPILVIQGEEDEFGSGTDVETLVAASGSHVTLARIPGGDHYFEGHIDEMKAVLSEYFQSGPGSDVIGGSIG
jgi:alpha/beta superfamily hydrolase